MREIMPESAVARENTPIQFICSVHGQGCDSQLPNFTKL